MGGQATALRAIALCAATAAGCRAEVARIEHDGLGAALALVTEAQAKQPAPLVLETEVVQVTADKDPTKPPTGYVAMNPMPRSGPSLGNAVLLYEPSADVALPILISGTEALSIQLRLERRRYSRPLTHDLLDEVLERLGAKLVRVQVDDLRDNTYIGTVVLEKGGEILKLDARPSDAIALAIGNRVPIYVSKKLLEKAGVRPEDLVNPAVQEKREPIAL
jgi:bifunctional DNase/RNase